MRVSEVLHSSRMSAVSLHYLGSSPGQQPVQHFPCQVCQSLDIERIDQQSFSSCRTISRTGALLEANNVVPQASAFISDQDSTNGTGK